MKFSYKTYYLLLFISLVASCSKKYTGEVSFKNYKITYPIHDEEKENELYSDHNIPNQWEYESAMRKLALCLCEKYIQKPDPKIKEKITEIYMYKFEFYPRNNTFKKVDFDSILINKEEVFNSEILVD
ncbi:hypothetical protein [Chryseobacterium gwangjuense]|uniref:hypothetical protein n=1 Tax=Chryseobacterium gwangjuense TaxID=1069980 RepID=UPI001E44393E|nr:hypothetical protein [Chryseobacterium gwangjuense]MCE3074708.1 hypothetical protein [Chryseobacterium gwangjuense]